MTDIEKLAERLEKLAETTSLFDREQSAFRSAAAALRSEHEARVKAERERDCLREVKDIRDGITDALEAAGYFHMSNAEGVASICSALEAAEARAEAAERERDEAARKHAKISEWITLDCRTQYERAEAAEARLAAAEREKERLKAERDEAREVIRKVRAIYVQHDDHNAWGHAINVIDAFLGGNNTEPAVTPGVPVGYRKLPTGTRCRCVKLWRQGDEYYCCSGGNNAEPA